MQGSLVWFYHHRVLHFSHPAALCTHCQVQLILAHCVPTPLPHPSPQPLAYLTSSAAIASVGREHTSTRARAGEWRSISLIESRTATLKHGRAAAADHEVAWAVRTEMRREETGKTPIRIGQKKWVVENTVLLISVNLLKQTA